MLSPSGTNYNGQKEHSHNMAWTIDESSADSFRRDQLTPGCLVDRNDEGSGGRQQTSSLFKSGKE